MGKEIGPLYAKRSVNTEAALARVWRIICSVTSKAAVSNI